jgi:hypothetical protein
VSLFNILGVYNRFHLPLVGFIEYVLTRHTVYAKEFTNGIKLVNYLKKPIHFDFIDQCPAATGAAWFRSDIGLGIVFHFSYCNLNCPAFNGNYEISLDSATLFCFYNNTN